MQPLSVDDAIAFISTHRKYLDEGHWRRLRDLSGDFQHETLDLVDEVKQQLLLVKKLRERIGDRERTNPERLDTKDYKDLIASSTSLFTILTKLHSEILTQDRLRKIEEAAYEAIRGLDAPAQAAFFTHLEALLARGTP